MTDEERRQMVRQNYYAQLAALGYGPDGNALVDGNDSTNKKTGGWISVKDRLPEEKQFVLVYGESLHSNKHDAGCMAVSWRVDYNYWFGFGRTGAITHWMPLPEPPKEDV